VIWFYFASKHSKIVINVYDEYIRSV